MNFLKRAENANKKFFYKLFRRMFRNEEARLPLEAARVRKILLFRYDAIGDMVVTTPVFNLLRESLPQAEIHVICSPYNYPIIKNDERIQRYFLHDGTLRSFWRLLRECRKEGYDLILAYVLFRTTYAGLMANLIGGRRATKVTILHEERRELYSTFFNVQIGLKRDTCTMAELQVKMLCELFHWHYSPGMVRLGMRLDADSRAVAESFCSRNSLVDFTVLNISAGREYRRWSVAKNREFLHRVLARTPAHEFVIVAAPSDLQDAEAIAEGFPQVCVFPPSPNILDVCAVIERAAIVVSPDTSVVHIASAFGRPTLAFYSYTTAYVMEWLPFGVPNRYLISRDKLPIETIEAGAAAESFMELYDEVFFTKTPAQTHENRI